MYMLPILNIETSIHCASHGVIILWNDTLVSTERTFYSPKIPFDWAGIVISPNQVN